MESLFGRNTIAGQVSSACLIISLVAISLFAHAAMSARPALAQIKPAPPAEEASPETKAPAQPKSKIKPNVRKFEGTMTLSRMNEIIRRLDPKANAPQPGAWKFTISDRPVMIITDILANRMRIISPIAKVAGLPQGALERMMQANFDTALDARYAIARGAVWATFIHPLSELHDRQFISAIGQTVNLSLTFGKTFSSGGTSFGGGDSRDIIRKKLIEQLQKKGLPI